ncbi:MAG: hypothetical protein Kow00103_09610 [Candidatus Caldatribacteriota bacterium]
MKGLVVFYSRSGNTRKIAQEISAALKFDSEEILDTKSRKGILGFLSAGNDAMQRRLTLLKEIKYDPSLYELIVIGTPVWAGNLSAPIRTYLNIHKKNFPQVAFFYTGVSSDNGKVFKDMEEICGKKPLSLLEVTSREIKRNIYYEKMKKFIDHLSKEMKKINGN